MEIQKHHVIGAAVLIVLVLAIALPAVLQPAPQASAYDDFAQCLKDQKAVFYGAFWCPHCNDQKALFEKSGRLPYVECSLPDRSGQTLVCAQAGIESYPTWVFADGSRLTGVVSLQQLAQKTGCLLPP